LSTVIAKKLNKGERVFSNLKMILGIGALKKFNEDIIGDTANKEDLANPKKLLFYWHNIHEWNHLKNGTIIVDEMTRYFNPRQWAMLSEDTEIKLQQHGKEDLEIWGTTQHYSRIDLTLRLLVEKFLIVQTIFGNPDNKKRWFGIKLFRITSVELEDIEDWYQMEKRPDLKLVIPVKSRIRFLRKKYAEIYDTRQTVGRSEAMPLVHKERSCEVCGKIVESHV